MSGARRCRWAAALGLAVGLVAPAAAAQGGGATPEGSNGYRALDEAGALVSRWLASGLAERIELGASAGGRELVAIQYGGRGPTPLAERTTVLLVGGLDGISTAGTEAVLRVTDALLANPDLLPPGATFVAVPWGNPDGLARWTATSCGGGRNDRAIDDDRDGAFDEDGPDDLDGDGVILELLIEDPFGPWARTADGRFLRPAREGEAPRFQRVREGRDDDGDGRYNEDPPGGVSLDHNFPVGWSGPWSGVASGPWPLSEPAARALADLARTRRTALALVFQGNHGRLAAPGGRASGDGVLALPFRADEPVYDQLNTAFHQATGRPARPWARLAEARGREHPGAAIDWLYTALGALAMEVAVWGPEVEGAAEGALEANPTDARFRSRPDAIAPDVLPTDRAWSRWLDDTRGGIGFVDWQPVDLGDGRQGLVGGWEPRTCFNPPGDSLARSLQGLDAFVRQLAAGLPRLEVDVRESRRDGRVCLLRANVRNAGTLPSGVGPDSDGLNVTLELHIPEGVRLLAGEARVELDHLPGGGSSRDLEWLLLAPEGSVFRFELSSRWGRPRATEVRL